jgi:hypothetical protein
MNKHLWREHYDLYRDHFNRLNCNHRWLIGFGRRIVIAAVLNPERDLDCFHYGPFWDSQAGIEHRPGPSGNRLHLDGYYQGNPGFTLVLVEKFIRAVSIKTQRFFYFF